MSGLIVVARERVARVRLTRTQVATALVAAIVVVTMILHVAWLVRFRRADIVEWDEAGYMQFSLSNFDALHDQGLWTFAKTVAGRETFGPLFPFVVSLGYPITGRTVFGGLLVMPLIVRASVLVAASLVLTRAYFPYRYGALFELEGHVAWITLLRNFVLVALAVYLTASLRPSGSGRRW